MIDTVKHKEKGFISEPVLWTPTWVHLGCLNSVTECEIMMLDPSGFCDIIYRNPAALAVTAKYAKEFVKTLNSVEQPNLSDIPQRQQTLATGPTWKVMND